MKTIPLRKNPNITNLYYNKAKHNRLLKHVFNALDVSKKSRLAQLYHQAWNIISISLLQRTRSIQHIIHALIYHQKTKSTLSLPPTPSRVRISQPTGQKFVPTVLENHLFTRTPTNINASLRTPYLSNPIQHAGAHIHARPWYNPRQRHLLPAIPHLQPHLQPRSTRYNQTLTCRYHTTLPMTGPCRAYVSATISSKTCPTNYR